MRKKVIIGLAVSLLWGATVQAASVKSTDLQAMCSDLKKSEVGEAFDHEAIARCQGYLTGFFDTMIILEKMKQYQYFCVPSSVPKESNARILNEWIAANSKIAKDTTAAVALLAAYQKAFPCPSQRQQKKK